MRLIDTNALKKRWTIPSPEPYNTDAAEVLDTIEAAPTVDAVEVVRCRDCRHTRPMNSTESAVYLDECMVCRNAEATIDGYNIVMPEHFCSYGERRCE